MLESCYHNLLIFFLFVRQKKKIVSGCFLNSVPIDRQFLNCMILLQVMTKSTKMNKISLPYI